MRENQENSKADTSLVLLESELKSTKIWDIFETCGFNINIKYLCECCHTAIKTVVL